MPAGVWKALVGVIAVLVVAVVALDQWQTRQGLTSLFWSPGRPVAEARAARAVTGLPQGLPPSPPAASGAPRMAIIVDDLGSRRDVFDLVREIGRPLAVGVLPDLPLSAWIAAEASRMGLEVLLDLPMEPYRFPELDPGPGALMMAMAPETLGRMVAKHLAAMPSAVGATNHMGSRMTEDRGRMRAALEPLAERHLIFVDALTSNHSVAFEEARRLGLRVGRRQVVVDHSGGEAAERERWDEAGRLVMERGEAIVLAHGHPLTLRLLKEYVAKWEAAGIRLVHVSQLTR
jgi:polysaccharide deacetylase 2 family uncharacterized protein YibQ